MEDPIQRYRTKSSDRHRRRRKPFQSIERLQKEVYKTQQTISSTDDKREMHKSSRAADHSQSKSKSRGSRARPFDEHGYCRMHPDVRLAKKKASGGWIMLQGTCHKCLRRRPSPSTESLTDDSYQEQSKKRSEHHRARSSSRGRRRGAAVNDDKSSATQRSRSRSIRARSKSLSKRIKGSRLVCVDGAPFDKSGRCFVHNHVKLASKKLLGGWKIHYPFCPECAKKDDMYDENCSVISGISGFSRGSFASGRDDYSVASSAYHSRGGGGRGDSSVRSSRSHKSSGSVATWSSKQSRKRIDKNGSFLPLDADGYCLHHPEVQLAEVDRKGGWNVLLDFCPECAEETLIIGGPVPGPRKSRHHHSSRSVSSRSTRSAKSAESAGTFVDKMPYIDGEGQTGYYTGHVNGDGRPTGRGKMKYKNGSKFEGVWDEGTKIHGKTTQSKGKTDATASTQRHRSKSNHRHSKKNEPRCKEQSRKSGGSRSRIRNER